MKHFLKEKDKKIVEKFLYNFRSQKFAKNMPEDHKKKFLLYILFYLDWVAQVKKTYFLGLKWTANMEKGFLQLKQKSLSDYLFNESSWKNKSNLKLQLSDRSENFDNIEFSEIIEEELSRIYDSVERFFLNFSDQNLEHIHDPELKKFAKTKLKWDALIQTWLYPVINHIHPIKKVSINDYIEGEYFIDLKVENEDRLNFISYVYYNSLPLDYNYYVPFKKQNFLDKIYDKLSWL